VPRLRPGKARPRRLVSIIFSLLFLVVQWAFSSLSPWLNLFRDDPIVWRTFGLAGAAGTGKSHLLVALGAAAVQAGHKVRYFTAADLAETLYRGLADNSVGRMIDALLRNDLILIDEVGFAPLDDTGAQLLFRVVAAAYERRALGIASHWPFDQWGRFLPEHTTAVSLLDRLLHHDSVVVTDGDSYRMRQARARKGTTLNKT